MPVRGRGVRGASFQGERVHFANYADQAAETAEQVHRMSYGQNIEEGVAYVGGESESLGSKLQPSKSLVSYEEKSQAEGDVKPARRSRGFGLSVAHKRRGRAAGQFERGGRA